MALQRFNPTNNPLLRTPDFIRDRLPIAASGLGLVGFIAFSNYPWWARLLAVIATAVLMSRASIGIIRWQKTADLASDKMITGNLTGDDLKRLDPATS